MRTLLIKWQYKKVFEKPVNKSDQSGTESEFQISLTLTAEGTVPPWSDVDTTVLTLVYISFNRFTQCGVRAPQRAQVKHTVLEEALHKNTQLKRYDLNLCD